MAKATVNQPAHNLFQMSAQYLIAPDSDPEELLNDASCLMTSAIGVLEADTDALNDAHWGALYLFQQAKGMMDEAIGAIGTARLTTVSHQKQADKFDTDQEATTCETSEGLSESQKIQQRERLEAAGGCFLIFPLAEQMARWQASLARA